MPLSIGALALPVDLVWTDEFQWTGISQSVQRTVAGALLVEESAGAAGRFITLEGAEDAAWATRTQIEALRALAEQANEIHELTLPDGRTFDVMFRRPAFDARPLVPFNVAAADDAYVLSRINLIEV